MYIPQFQDENPSISVKMITDMSAVDSRNDHCIEDDDERNDVPGQDQGNDQGCCKNDESDNILNVNEEKIEIEREILKLIVSNNKDILYLCEITLLSSYAVSKNNVNFLKNSDFCQKMTVFGAKGRKNVLK
jgi:hypothetical protein